MRTYVLGVLLSVAPWLAQGAEANEPSAPVVAQSRLVLNIPAQSLTGALEELSHQAGVQILHRDPAAGTEPKTQEVKGTFSLREALDRLLSQTGYRYEMVNDRTVRVWTTAEKESAVKGGQSALDNRPLVLAQALPSEPDKINGPIANSASSIEGGDNGLQEVVVTGTHIRGASSPIMSPVITIGREEIDRNGYVTTQDIFQKLPQNFSDVTFSSALALEGTSALAQSNVDRATGVDLRGLGANSTLTLVDGQRRAGSLDGQVVDLSAIPLSVIQSVEIVTGGRSAIYGSDAVGGVVNIITRHDFDGAQTQASYGWGENGGETLQLSQIVGMRSDYGGFVAAYDFYKEWPLDLVDTGLYVSPIPSNGHTLLQLDIQPTSKRNSGYLAGTLNLGERTKVTADALYTSRTFDTANVFLFARAINPSHDFDNSDSHQYSASVSALTKLGGDWALDLSGVDSRVQNDFASNLLYSLPTRSIALPFSQSSDTRLSTVSAVADGSLPGLGSVTPRMALGVERRWESFKKTQGATFIDRDRSVDSAFMEFLVPLPERVEVSLAGRYDDYSDFGSTFNPQFGVSWGLTQSVTFRGAFSRAFRAPALVELGSAGSPTTVVELSELQDPSVAAGTSPTLFVTGDNPNLRPERAKTWSVGFDIAPPSTPGFKATADLFDINYENRIDTPAADFTDQQLFLAQESRYPGLVDRTPTSQDVSELLATGQFSNDTSTPFDPKTQNLLTTFPGLVVVDDRTNNIAKEHIRGVDISLSDKHQTGVGILTFGLNTTYTITHDRSVSPTSPPFTMINEIGKPLRFRARLSSGISRGPLELFAYLNYAGDYHNPFSTPPSEMSSWTTVDTTLRFRGSELSGSSVLSGFDVTLAVTNLMDRAPPAFLNSGNGLRYDATNATAIGRFVTLNVVKKW